MSSDLEKVKAMYPDLSPDVEALNSTDNGTQSPLNTKSDRVLADQIPETHQQLQDAAVDFLHTEGYIVAAVRPARIVRGGKETYRTAWEYDGKGHPDLVAAYYRFDGKKRPVLWIEVKTAKDILRPDQEKWWRALVLSGANYWLLKPGSVEWEKFVEWVKSK